MSDAWRFPEMIEATGKRDAELAKEFGCSRSTIARWRAGTHEPHRLILPEVAFRLAVLAILKESRERALQLLEDWRKRYTVDASTEDR